MPKPETFDRTEVMEKITDLFWEKGYNGTSMQDIVDASGLNRSSLYNSFGDKHRLFEASIEHYKRHVQDASLELVRNLSAREAIRVLFEGILQAVDKGDAKGCYLANCTSEVASHDKRVFRALHSNMKHMVDVFATILERGKQEGQINRSLDARQTALYLFSSLQGIRLTAILATSRKEIEQLIDQTLEGI